MTGELKRGEEGENPPHSPFNKGDEIPDKRCLRGANAPLIFSSPFP